jgi:hypothetical protein
MTPRAVFDCMVFLQGAGRPAGPAAACLRLLDEEKVMLCVRFGGESSSSPMASKSQLANCRHWQEKVQLVIEQGLKSEPQVELARPVVQGIHGYRSDSDFIGKSLDSPQRVDEEVATQSLSLL